MAIGPQQILIAGLVVFGIVVVVAVIKLLKVAKGCDTGT